MINTNINIRYTSYTSKGRPTHITISIGAKVNEHWTEHKHRLKVIVPCSEGHSVFHSTCLIPFFRVIQLFLLTFHFFKYILEADRSGV